MKGLNTAAYKHTLHLRLQNFWICRYLLVFLARVLCVIRHKQQPLPLVERQSINLRCVRMSDILRLHELASILTCTFRCNLSHENVFASSRLQEETSANCNPPVASMLDWACTRRLCQGADSYEKQ